MMKRALSVTMVLWVLWVVFAFPGWVSSQNGPVVGVLPASITLDPGESRSVEIQVANVADLWAFDITIQFDPARISASGPQFGAFLSPGFDWIIQDHTAGTLTFVRTQNSGEPQTGEGILASFTIQAKDIAGTTPLTLINCELSDRDGHLFPCDVVNGTVSITGDPVGDFRNYLPLIYR